MNRLLTFFEPSKTVPDGHRKNFVNLYFDIGWFGVLNGSILAFISVYAARIGGTSTQVGLIVAAPAMVNLIFSLPTGMWLQNRCTWKAVFWASVAMRIFYFALIPLPMLLNYDTQIWVIIGITLAMSIPGVGLAVGFNTLLAEAVPPEYRGHVVGIRNAAFAIITAATTFICGIILNRFEFPKGYEIVFLIGAIGAAMSSLHLFFVRPISSTDLSDCNNSPDQLKQPNVQMDLSQKKENFLTGLSKKLNTGVLSGHFGFLLFLLMLFTFFQYAPSPIFTLYMVNRLNLTDQIIGIGTAFFYLLVFIGSLRFESLVSRWGNQKVAGIGALLMACYPLLLSISFQPWIYILTSCIGGVAWAMAGAATINYLLEYVPADNRPVYLAWYSVVSNAAILSASIIGPIVGDGIGLAAALILFGFGRLIAGLGILKFG